jgi:D-serine deaminase-like pyridoxal phosphate-dependent protein
MAVDQIVKPGISKWDLDTPALCVDLDKMEKNIATMQATLKKNGLESRPHSKTHKRAALATPAQDRIDRHLLRQADGSGIWYNGVDKILMTTANPSKSKIRRAMILKKAHGDFIQAVDEEQTRGTCRTPRRRPVSRRMS